MSKKIPPSKVIPKKFSSSESSSSGSSSEKLPFSSSSSKTFSLAHLPGDALWDIMQHLPYKFRRDLAATCLFISNLYRQRKLGTKNVLGVPLMFGKVEVMEEITQSPNRIAKVIAPPSWGKTVCTIFLPFLGLKRLDTPVLGNSERFVISVPHKLITHHIQEIQKFLPTALNRKNPED